MEQLNEVIARATSSIGGLYFQLPIAGGDPVFRERVYCYEFYHQLRRIWPLNTQYCLNGEVDKQGHTLVLGTGARAASPDLLVHIPGSMDGNHAIIEVKAGSAQTGGICKDIRTLSEYRRLVGYERAIYLFYGYIPEDKLAHAISLVAEEGKPVAPIELWIHPSPGVHAEFVRLL